MATHRCETVTQKNPCALVSFPAQTLRQSSSLKFSNGGVFLAFFFFSSQIQITSKCSCSGNFLRAQTGGSSPEVRGGTFFHTTWISSSEGWGEEVTIGQNKLEMVSLGMCSGHSLLSCSDMLPLRCSDSIDVVTWWGWRGIVLGMEVQYCSWPLLGGQECG